MTTSFLDYLEQKHGLLPAGEHVFEIVPQSARLFDAQGVSGVAFKVKVVDGPEAGREGEISLTLGGQYDGLIRQTLDLVRPWAEAVSADLSPERIKGDITRLVAALRVAGVGKRTIGTFRHDERKGKKYLALTSVRVDDGKTAGGDNDPFN